MRATLRDDVKTGKKGLTLANLCCGAEEGAEKNHFVVTNDWVVCLDKVPLDPIFVFDPPLKMIPWCSIRANAAKYNIYTGTQQSPQSSTAGSRYCQPCVHLIFVVCYYIPHSKKNKSLS